MQNYVSLISIKAETTAPKTIDLIHNFLSPKLEAMLIPIISFIMDNKATRARISIPI